MASERKKEKCVRSFGKESKRRRRREEEEVFFCAAIKQCPTKGTEEKDLDYCCRRGKKKIPEERENLFR